MIKLLLMLSVLAVGAVVALFGCIKSDEQAILLISIFILALFLIFNAGF